MDEETVLKHVNGKKKKTLIFIVILCVVIGLIFFLISIFFKSSNEIDFLNSFPSSVDDIEKQIGKPSFTSNNGSSLFWYKVNLCGQSGLLTVNANNNKVSKITYTYRIIPYNKENGEMTYIDLYGKYGTGGATSDEISVVISLYADLYQSFESQFGDVYRTYNDGRCSVWKAGNSEIILTDYVDYGFSDKMRDLIIIEWRYN